MISFMGEDYDMMKIYSNHRNEEKEVWYGIGVAG